MTAPNTRGRRQTLVPTADNPENDEQILAEAALATGQDDGGDFRMLYPGAEIEASVTLAIDFGDGKTNFVKYGVKDLVQEDEDHPEVYARLATVVNEGVISLIDDVQDRLATYEQELARRQHVIERQTSGQ